jgi:hypothetical protein
MEQAASTQHLASRALDLLRIGDIDGASRVIEVLANGPVEPHSSARARPAKHSSPVAAEALRCSVGFPYEVAAHLSPNPDHTSLSSDALRKLLVDDFDDLYAAQECMTYLAAIGDQPSIWSWACPLQSGNHQSTFTSPSHEEREVRHSFLGRLLSAQRARQSVSNRIVLRLIWIARESGMSQRDIGRLIQRPQTHVFRELQAIEEDPDALNLRPRELFECYQAGDVDRAMLIKLLAAYPYESGTYARDEPEWGYTKGTWDELSQLKVEGSITQEELEAVVAASRKLALHDA